MTLLSREDTTKCIVDAMDDEKEWSSICSYLQKHYIPEIANFLEWHKKYESEDDDKIRQQIGDEMIRKFLTFEGDACISDYILCAKEVNRKIKKLKGAVYPKDLFIGAYDKCMFRITQEWADIQNQ